MATVELDEHFSDTEKYLYGAFVDGAANEIRRDIKLLVFDHRCPFCRQHISDHSENCKIRETGLIDIQCKAEHTLGVLRVWLKNETKPTYKE